MDGWPNRNTLSNKPHISFLYLITGSRVLEIVELKNTDATEILNELAAIKRFAESDDTDSVDLTHLLLSLMGHTIQRQAIKDVKQSA